MRAIRIVEPHRFEMVDEPVPTPADDEAIVNVESCGLCGTDSHIIAGEWPDEFRSIIPGHEFSGTVAAVGSSVTHLSEGDRVAVDPTVFCGRCRYCKIGRGNLCDNWGAVGGTRDGGFADAVSVPAANAHQLPDTIDFNDAAMIEPVSCAIHGLDRLHLNLGQSVLIYGAGTMGLLLAQLLRHGNAGMVAFCDIKPSRLERARGFGFALGASSFEDLRDHAPLGFDAVIDATGVTKVVETALDAVAKAGTLLVFGVAPKHERASYSPALVNHNELTIIGSHSVFNSYSRAVTALEQGLVDTTDMVSHVLSLESFGEAVDLMRSGEGLKIQIAPQHAGP